MKKVVGVLVLAMMLASSIGVFAAEDSADAKFTTNMDAETYLETRMEQIDEAFEEGTITEEEAELLRAHVKEVSEEGTFGTGPSNGNKGEGNAECVLGEGANSGIFRSESAGQRLGNGNGVGLQKKDGSGKGNSRGNGQGNRGNGIGLKNGNGNGFDGDCVLD